MGKFILKVDGTKISEERGIDLVAGTNVTLTTTYTEEGHEAATVSIAATGGGGAMATDTIWDAKGDLALGTGADTAARLAVGADDTILMADAAASTGAKWVASAAPGIATAVLQTGTADTFARSDHTHESMSIVKTADETIASDVTLSNDTALLFAIGASATEIWFFELFLIITAANATMDFKCGWSVPAAATMTWVPWSFSTATTTPSYTIEAVGAGAVAAVLTGGSTLSIGTAAVTMAKAFSGWVFGGGTAGNANFQWAQNTSDAGNLTVAKGSMLRATKLVA